MKNSTIVAIATPTGESAIGILRISGELSKEIALKAFNLKKDIKARYANFGKYTSLDKNVIDECLYVFFNNNSSYTGEDSLEIYTHGNPFILRKILEDLIERGCRRAEPGEFTKRAFLNGKMDLSQAEAVEEIIKARSERALSAAHKLLSGELGKRISVWSDKILNLLAEIESQIDFSDEDIPMFHVEHFRNEIEKLKLELKQTEDTARYSTTIHEGINIVIVGAPNAGKSSLLNVLTGKTRAIVSDEAGTTRDFIAEDLNIGSYRIRLIDTAGIRKDFATDIEKFGINLAIDCIKEGDFYLFVIDSSLPCPTLPNEVLSYLNPDKTLILLNKSDLNSSFNADDLFPEYDKINICLKDSRDSERLKAFLKKIIEDKELVPDSDVLVVSERHAEALKVARNELILALEASEMASLEFVASRLRAALNDLSEILGRFDNEKVLDKVFSGFCIGK